jgi:hypothetical protein
LDSINRDATGQVYAAQGQVPMIAIESGGFSALESVTIAQNFDPKLF